MDNNILTVIYHNAYGKRNRMLIDMDSFFPCHKTWLERLIKTVLIRSDEYEEHMETITRYLAKKYNEELLLNKIAPTDKGQTREKKYRACLDMLGGKYGQQSNIITG